MMMVNNRFVVAIAKYSRYITTNSRCSCEPRGMWAGGGYYFMEIKILLGKIINFFTRSQALACRLDRSYAQGLELDQFLTAHGQFREACEKNDHKQLESTWRQLESMSFGIGIYNINMSYYMGLDITLAQSRETVADILLLIDDSIRANGQICAQSSCTNKDRAVQKVLRDIRQAALNAAIERDVEKDNTSDLLQHVSAGGEPTVAIDVAVRKRTLPMFQHVLKTYGDGMRDAKSQAHFNKLFVSLVNDCVFEGALVPFAEALAAYVTVDDEMVKLANKGLDEILTGNVSRILHPLQIQLLQAARVPLPGGLLDIAQAQQERWATVAATLQSTAQHPALPAAAAKDNRPKI